jgi:cobalt-precorrin-7 (C5)-methyltransferase
VVLPRPGDWPIERVAAYLRDGGLDPGATALVFECLTLPDEERTATTVGDLAAGADAGEDDRFDHLSVLVVRR